MILHLFADCLKDQVVWITGASYGIGAACALEAAKHGAKVVISARSEPQLEDVKRKCIGNVHLKSLMAFKTKGSYSNKWPTSYHEIV